jgi:DNA-binding MarR family transcriptional regulator
MQVDTKKVEAVTREIRHCFNRLKAAGDDLHRDLGITASMRAVLESLHAASERTVPDVAREKRVSRQHIQVLVNELAGGGFVRTYPNPNDKRSPLVTLTATGRATFEGMRRREATVLSELARAVTECDLDATLATLRAIHAYLDTMLHKGDVHD